MNSSTAYEANLYWICNCGYEMNSLWYYEGNGSYKFKCDGCGKFSIVAPPNSENEEAETHPPTTQAQNKPE